MTEPMRNSLRVAGGALALGVLGDAFLRATPWGLNALVWVAALAAAIWLGPRSANSLMARRWTAPLILFAAFFALRDSTTLKLLDGLAIVSILSLAAIRELRSAGFLDYLIAAAKSGFDVVFGPLILLAKDISWRELPRGGWSWAVSMLIGLMIGIPLLLIFGGLFMAADAVFARGVKVAFDVSFEELLGHVFLAGFLAWVTGGLLRGLLLKSEPLASLGERPPFLSLGVVEVGVVLGLVDLLFLSFVLVQVGYLFGGASRVEATVGLTYADYARRGFFELVAVTSLVLPVLLILHWLLRPQTPREKRTFGILAGVQLVLLAVIMCSALQRMRVYQSEFGLTELRLYITAFMLWLGVVFVWFSLTVLRGRRPRFAFGALASGLVAIAALHLLNPDGLIVRTNVARTRAGATLDAAYATSLSADAVPILIAEMPRLNDHDRAVIAGGVIERWSPPDRPGWRTWNWGRSKAWRAVRENWSELQAAVSTPSPVAETSLPIEPELPRHREITLFDALCGFLLPTGASSEVGCVPVIHRFPSG